MTSLDPDLAIYEIEHDAPVIDRQTWFYTVFGTFFMAFGFCALFLAAAGLYGVMSFAVTQRTREMGVRSALGARGAQLILLVMRRSVVQLVDRVVARTGAGAARVRGAAAGAISREPARHGGLCGGAGHTGDGKSVASSCRRGA